RKVAVARKLSYQRLLYVRDMANTSREVDLAHVHNAINILNFHRPTPNDEDVRTFEWYHLWHACHAERLILPGIKFALSPDGKMLASATGKQVKLLDSATGKEL